MSYKFEGEVCYHVPAGPEKHYVLFSFIQTPSVTEANKVTASYSQSSGWQQFEAWLYYLPACDLYTNLPTSLNLSFPSSAGEKKV